jgi:photosystem II stability/assembly factor-like uncharacterized protein
MNPPTAAALLSCFSDVGECVAGQPVGRWAWAIGEPLPRMGEADIPRAADDGTGLSHLLALHLRPRIALGLRTACGVVGVLAVGLLAGGGAFGATAVAPRIVSIGITPSDVIRTSTVTATVTTKDPGHRVTLRYRWLRNGERVARATSKSIDLAHHAFRKGDRLRVRVTAVAGSRSTTKTSTAIVVRDAAPKVTSLAIDPAAPTRGDTLSATLRASDIDGDHLSQKRTWSWACSGSASGSVVAPTIAPTDLGIDHGCSVSLSDRVSDGMRTVVANAPAVVIGDSPPTLGHASVAYDPSTATATIDAAPVDADGDSLQTTVRWTIDGFDAGGSATLDLAGADAHLGDVIRALVRVTDSQGASSGWVAATPATISGGVSAPQPMNDWQLYTELNGSAVYGVFPVQSNPSHLYVIDELGFGSSTDAGATWSSASGPCRGDGFAVAYAPSAPQTVYAGCANSGTYRSDDSGATWQSIPITTGSVNLGTSYTWGVKALAVDPTNPDVAYAVCGTCGSIWRTTDAGQSWQTVGTDPQWGESVAVKPNDPNYVVVGSADGIMVTNDGGDTWEGPYGSGPMRVAFDPNDTSQLWAIAYQALTSSLLHSTDGGQTWTTVTTSPSQLSALAVADGVIYVGDKTGDVSQSTDGGATWSTNRLAYSGGGQVDSLAVDPTDANHVYVGFYGGLVAGLEFRPDLPQGTWRYNTVRLDSVTTTPTTATLNATVAPLLPGSIGWVEWHWGSITPEDNHTFTVVTGSATEQSVSTTLTGLTPNTTYRFVASGLFGAPDGQFISDTPEVSFTTPPA